MLFVLLFESVGCCKPPGIGGLISLSQGGFDVIVFLPVRPLLRLSSRFPFRKPTAAGRLPFIPDGCIIGAEDD